jgi:sporulation protein YlmC with PRC-barrel domain
MSTHVRLDDLLGRTVRDAQGRSVGRIYDMRGEQRAGELVIVEYHLGTGALLERIGLSLKSLVGMHRPEPSTVPWDQMDISDPEHPVIRAGGSSPKTSAA